MSIISCIICFISVQMRLSVYDQSAIESCNRQPRSPQSGHSPKSKRPLSPTAHVHCLRNCEDSTAHQRSNNLRHGNGNIV